MQSSLLYGLLHMQKLKMVSKIPPPMQRLCMHVLRTLAHSRSESVSERHFSGAVQRQLLGCTSVSIAHIAEATTVHIANGNCCHDFWNVGVCITGRLMSTIYSKKKKKHHYHLATEHAINTRIIPQFNLMPLQLQEIRKVAQNAQKYDKR